jgi:hypothetical protein
VGSGGARRHHNPVEILFLDSRLNLVDSGLGTGVEVFFHKDDMGQRLGILSQLATVKITSNVTAAVADEHPNAKIFSQFDTSVFSPRRARRN